MSTFLRDRPRGQVVRCVSSLASPPGIARLQVGSPDRETNSSMKPKEASFETAEPVELDTRSVFPNHDKTVFFSLFGQHAQNSDHLRSRACSVTGGLTQKLRI